MLGQRCTLERSGLNCSQWILINTWNFQPQNGALTYFLAVCENFNPPMSKLSLFWCLYRCICFLLPLLILVSHVQNLIIEILGQFLLIVLVCGSKRDGFERIRTRATQNGDLPPPADGRRASARLLDPEQERRLRGNPELFSAHYRFLNLLLRHLFSRLCPCFLRSTLFQF